MRRLMAVLPLGALCLLIGCGGGGDARPPVDGEVLVSPTDIDAGGQDGPGGPDVPGMGPDTVQGDTTPQDTPAGPDGSGELPGEDASPPTDVPDHGDTVTDSATDDTIEDTDTNASDDGGGGGDRTGPAFGGIAFANAPDPETITLRWFTATDDTSPSSALRYRVYSAQDEEELVDPCATGRLALVEVQNETLATITGLAGGISLWVTVQAVDEAGNCSPPPQAVSITTPATPVVMRNAVHTLDELGLQAGAIGPGTFTVTGEASALPAVGDIVILPNDHGRWLRRIIAIEPREHDVVWSTERASLSDVFEGAQLHAHATLLEPPTAPVLGTASARPTVWRYMDPAGAFTMEQRVGPRTIARPAAKAGGSTEFDQGVDLDWSVGFEPSFDATLVWDEGIVDLPESISLTAKGSLVFDAIAGLHLDGSGTYAAEQTLFERSATFSYAVGAVPVVQDVTLAVKAEIEVAAEASFSMAAQVRAEKWVQLDLAYRHGSGWSLTKDEGFEHEITFEVDGEVVATAKIRLVLEISTTFYKAARASLFVAPSLDVEARARFLPPPVELTQFDVTFLAEAWVSADLTVVGRELARWESDRYRLIQIPVHSLPELTLRPRDRTIDTCRPRPLFLAVADGYGNPVAPDAIEWELIGGPGASLTVTNEESRTTAELDAPEPGVYTVRASAWGSGFLGPIGTRYVETTLTVVTPDEGCENPGGPDIGPADVFNCQDTPPCGLIGFPSVSPTMAGHGETVHFSFPAWCDRATYIKSVLVKETLPYHDPREGYVIVDINDRSLYVPDWSHAYPDNEIRADIRVGDSFPPGRYSATLNFQDTYQACSLACSDYRVFPEVFDTYSHSQTYTWRDDDGFWQTEACEVPIGIPSPRFRVVSVDPTDDGMGDPFRARTFALDLGTVTSRFHQSQDRDYYALLPGTGPGGGRSFDGELACDPLGWATVGIDDPSATVALYESPEAASAGDEPLVPAAPGVGFRLRGDEPLVLAVAGPSLSSPRDYTLRPGCEAEEAFFSRFLHMTGPLTLSAERVTPGAPVDVTIPITTDTDYVQIAALSAEGGTNGSNWVAVSRLIGSTEATARITLYPTASGPYFVAVRIRFAGSSGHRGTDYTRNPAAADDTYQATGTSADGQVRANWSTPIPIAWILAE